MCLAPQRISAEKLFNKRNLNTQSSICQMKSLLPYFLFPFLLFFSPYVHVYDSYVLSVTVCLRHTCNSKRVNYLMFCFLLCFHIHFDVFFFLLFFILLSIQDGESDAESFDGSTKYAKHISKSATQLNDDGISRKSNESPRHTRNVVNPSMYGVFQKTHGFFNSLKVCIFLFYFFSLIYWL